MLSHLYTATALSLGSLLILPSSVQAQSSQANCTVFNWDNNAAYIKENTPPIRVSAASSCAENSANFTCALTADGDELVSATNNITNLNTGTFAMVIDETVDNSTFPAPSFNESVIGSVSATRMLTPGQSGYLNFTAYLFCYTGTVENCTDGVEDDTGIEICAPVWHQDQSSSILDGIHTVVNVSEQVVEGGQLMDPYENQVSGDGDDGEGGAMSLKLNGGLAMFAAIVAGGLVMV
ncbi:hypothetical protein BDW59DRAFT_53566 [Aspergillus cavernicola]|uniref:Uncharacterized protein n=1 Tax=Aspergillus cavernicola TaxID=176166 RepID=A0ABR4IKB3_9EURO